ncbi:hypothetical protein SynSYN20_00195 [Synechococcus sp. SYN20]|nr:hypothetical protein SynSYN20_00195 [Synechococcus sp. SYN20]
MRAKLNHLKTEVSLFNQNASQKFQQAKKIFNASLMDTKPRSK